MILLDSSARPIIAHRGGSAAAPENTLAAFARAVRDGADAFELDVRLTKDGHVVVFHDRTVERTTNGRGAIADLTLAELRQLDAAALWRGERIGTQRIPLLAEVLDAFPSVPVIVELKAIEAGAPAVDVIRKAAAEHRVVFGAFDAAMMHAARERGLPTLASQRELMRLLPRVLLGAGDLRGPFHAVAMSPTYYRLPLPVSRFARSLPGPVHIWTVNDAAQAARLWRAGARGIVTDRTALMVEARTQLR